ncbi:hypothetical protein F5Y05DRAFT_408110 [Hypoxylon sp. FL0543]|nr:hypothetical protein F5Y05DRAFT_408110 [Hypoxylon sp. FL0543]
MYANGHNNTYLLNLLVYHRPLYPDKSISRLKKYPAPKRIGILDYDQTATANDSLFRTIFNPIRLYPAPSQQTQLPRRMFGLFFASMSIIMLAFLGAVIGYYVGHWHGRLAGFRLVVRLRIVEHQREQQ